MKDFSLFEIEDLVMDEDFIRWVNAPDDADISFWENWLKRHPHKQLMIAEGRRIVESIGAEQPVLEQAIVDAEVYKLLGTINVNKTPLVSSDRGSVRRLKWGYIAAACFALIILIPSARFFSHEKKKITNNSYTAISPSRLMVENVNSTGYTVTLPLPDGSSVQLASNSRISYDGRFDSLTTRDIYLSGQAFFIVKKNPSRPFRVFANDIVAKVLGTSFSVKAYEKDSVISVTVTTGKVSVYSHENITVGESVIPNKLSGIIVTPNQQLVYGKSSQGFEKILLENPAMLSVQSVNKSMAYEDVPVDKVFDDLGQDYGISIVYDNDVLKKCTVNADLSNESFYRKLDLICRAIGARYEVIDAQVVIQSTGCNN